MTVIENVSLQRLRETHFAVGCENPQMFRTNLDAFSRLGAKLPFFISLLICSPPPPPPFCPRSLQKHVGVFLLVKQVEIKE